MLLDVSACAAELLRKEVRQEACIALNCDSLYSLDKVFQRAGEIETGHAGGPIRLPASATTSVVCGNALNSLRASRGLDNSLWSFLFIECSEDNA